MTRVTLENKHLFLNKMVEFSTDRVTGIKEKFVAIVEKVNDKSLRISGFPQVGNNLKIESREINAI
jgi:hypothetical protein